MIIYEPKWKLVNLQCDSYKENWWNNCVLLRAGSSEWYSYQDNSYMYIPFIDSVPIEDEYQNNLSLQKELF